MRRLWGRGGRRKTSRTGARAPRRKRFGLFQFDFSSVAVALTTIRRRGTLSVPLSAPLFLPRYPSLHPSHRLGPDGTNEWVTPRCAHRSLVNRIVLSLLFVVVAYPLQPALLDSRRRRIGKGCSGAGV